MGTIGRKQMDVYKRLVKEKSTSEVLTQLNILLKNTMITSNVSKYFIDREKNGSEHALSTINTIIGNAAFNLTNLRTALKTSGKRIVASTMDAQKKWFKETFGSDEFEFIKAVEPDEWTEPLQTSKQETLNSLKKAASTIPWDNQFENLLRFGNN